MSGSRHELALKLIEPLLFRSLALTTYEVVGDRVNLFCGGSPDPVAWVARWVFDAARGGENRVYIGMDDVTDELRAMRERETKGAQ